MQNNLRNFILFLSFCASCFAQTSSDIADLQKHYEAFQYSTVLKKSITLLNNKESFDENQLLKIHTLKGASHFAIGDRLESRKTFIEALKIDDNYKLDNVKYSPKLLEHFKNVKKEFLDILSLSRSKAENENELIPTLKDPKINIDVESINSAVAKSILLPGLGHFDVNESGKGWLLTIASTITLGSLSYYIFDTHNKEHDYLQEKSSLIISSKYDKYNTSYKIRNTLILTYAAIWLYSQIDLLFFTNNIGSKYITAENSNFLGHDVKEKIIISLQIPF